MILSQGDEHLNRSRDVEKISSVMTDPSLRSFEEKIESSHLYGMWNPPAV